LGEGMVSGFSKSTELLPLSTALENHVLDHHKLD
jgi:hypothetical protein